MNWLSPQEIQSFVETGYLVKQGLFTAQEIKSVSSSISELASRQPEIGKQMAYFEQSVVNANEKVLARIERFVQYSEELKTFTYSDKIIGSLRQLFKEDSVLFKEKVNFKLPGGQGFTPHQDIQPGWDDYTSYFISVLVTIDPNTIENGCLEVAGGHHTKGMIGERWKPLAGAELEGMKFIAEPTEPGDVIFFDCYTPHQSGPNLTKDARRNLYLTFNRSSEGDHREKYYADKRKNFPPDFEREKDKEYKFLV